MCDLVIDKQSINSQHSILDSYYHAIVQGPSKLFNGGVANGMQSSVVTAALGKSGACSLRKIYRIRCLEISSMAILAKQFLARRILIVATHPHCKVADLRLCT